ncbi:MAG: AlkZ family DNA glycosylase [Acidimicrobiales bacterium]|nr:AlkZ family DNA glycosylase [Acidimicrobiales bacterium]
MGDDERRARMAVRHGLAPGTRFGSAEEVARALTVLHATEPGTPYLSAWARVPGFVRGEVERALEVDRTLVKQLAMRRTLFVFPRDLLPHALGSAAARVAVTERQKLAKDLVDAGVTDDPDAWIERGREATMARLAGGDELTAQELRADVPDIDVTIVSSPGKRYEAKVNLAGRLLTVLGAEGLVVRGSNSSHWRVSKPRWTSMAAWLGEVPVLPGADEGYREIIGRWLWTFGPGTVEDIRWWLGGTKAAVRTALADLSAVEVKLEGGDSGWLLPHDVDPVPDPGPWVALLPVLDATVMGWKQREWYLGPHAERLFDTAGNAGTTAWVNGRAVGAWVQDEAGRVELRMVEGVPTGARQALLAEADRLTDWLDGERVGTVYPSPAMRG